MTSPSILKTGIAFDTKLAMKELAALLSTALGIALVDSDGRYDEVKAFECTSAGLRMTLLEGPETGAPDFRLQVISAHLSWPAVQEIKHGQKHFTDISQHLIETLQHNLDNQAEIQFRTYDYDPIDDT